MAVYRQKGTRIYSYEFVVKGERFRGSTGHASKREAEAYERQVKEQARAAADKRSTGPVPTLDQVFARYWKVHAHKLASASSIAVHLRQTLAVLGGNTYIKDVGTADIARVLEVFAQSQIGKVTGVPITDSTVNRRMACLRHVWTMAADVWEYETKKIAWRSLKRAEPGPRVRHITREQAREIMAHLPPHITEVMAFSLATGLRLSRVEELTWADVNAATRTARVRLKRKGRMTLSDVPLNSEALSLITNRPQGAATDRVFNTTNRRKYWEAAVAKAGVTDFTWHDLRHTFATWLGQSKAPIHTIQAALQHSSIDMTMRYLHQTEGAVAGAVASLPPLTEQKVIDLDAGEHREVPIVSPHSSDDEAESA